MENARILSVALALTAFFGSTQTNASCTGIKPVEQIASRISRPVQPVDLVRLRDIGVLDLAFPDAHPLAISPDGKKVAFQLRQADPTTNDYCLAMMVMDIRPGAYPQIVDQGGDLIRLPFDFRGKASFPSGNPKPIDPAWSPDGLWIAFLKRVGATTQVWRADLRAGRSEAITKSDYDVLDFRISPDGHSIIFASSPALSAQRRKIDEEARNGFRFDDRWSPMSSNRPFPSAPTELSYFFLDVATGTVRTATAAEIALFRHPAGEVEALSASGRKAWVRLDPGIFPPSSQLVAEDSYGKAILCSAPTCEGRIGAPSWSDDGRTVRYFRREGWANSSTAMYEWAPGQAAPRRLFATNDVLAFCQPWRRKLLCLRESSVHPRKIVLLNPATGRDTNLYDPNPEFDSLTLGAVERMYWKNRFGIETYGDVILPVGFRRGVRYPLVIVQYESRGFLRGGTGDEYPIQAFANRGYVVLSFNRPQDIGLTKSPRDWIDAARIDLTDFADLRSVDSSLVTGIQMLVARGLVDPLRIGVTGLSDGVSNLQYSLVHNPKLYSAAIVSSAGFEPSYPLFVGSAALRDFIAAGYPALTGDQPSFWSNLSLTYNAPEIHTPMLMQLADDEYLASIEPYMALKAAGTPVEMFVFPDEHHIKWQPAHRLAIYARNIEWFDNWLKNKPGTESNKAFQTEPRDAVASHTNP